MRTNPANVFILAPMLTRWGLERLLQSAGGLVVSGSSNPLADAAEEIGARFPDIVVVDVAHYPLEEARPMIELSCGSIVALVSGEADDTAAPMPQCVHARTHPGAFVRTVMQLAGLRADPPAPVGTFNEPRPSHLHAARPTQKSTCQVEALTPKQREIVRAISVHASSPAKVIADKLHISEHTLRNHLSEIYSRLGVTRRTHLQALVAGQVDAFAADQRLWHA